MMAGMDQPDEFTPTPEERFDAFLKDVLAQRPPLLNALAADAAVFRAHRGEGSGPRTQGGTLLGVLHLLWSADDYLGLALYRVRASLHAMGVPILPRLLHFACTFFFGIRIGDLVVLKAGVYIPHGQVVLDGISIVGHGCVLAPWTTIGVLQRDVVGPELGDEVFVGTGAKILGDVKIGAGAQVGANAVVLRDVPACATVAGVPARVVSKTG